MDHFPSILIPEEWSEAVETVVYDSVTPTTLVCGAKNSGKTTFSRHLVNNLLTRYKKVAYLDTDVGQAEFTPPGCLSLTVIEDKINPDLAIPCIKTPERCFFFGDTTCRKDPTAYLQYIHALYDYYCEVYCKPDGSGNDGNNGVPLVINTPGWVKDTGYMALVDMLNYMSPSHVVKISTSAETKNLPAGEFWNDEADEATTLIEVKSASQVSSKKLVSGQKEARILRDFRIVAYFRQCFPAEFNVVTVKELAQAFIAHPPYEIAISSVKFVNLLNQVSSNDTQYCLSANIVGLGISAGDAKGLPQCVGLGMVRSIDTIRQKLSIITPAPAHALEKVDLLLQGLVQIPTYLLQLSGDKSYKKMFKSVFKCPFMQRDFDYHRYKDDFSLHSENLNKNKSGRFC